MKKIALLIVVFAAMLLQAHATPARAAPVGWVSALGNDSQNCTVADPCETFAAAITQTFEGGVVRCLGPVGFNSNSPSFTIAASITIDCQGSGATIVEYGAGPFSINAPGAVVTLRGLDLNGLADSTTVTPTAVNGVVIQAAAQVNIEDCVIENFPQSGISVTTSVNTVINIKNTTIRNSANGISFAPTGASVNGSIDHATIVKMSGDGITGTGAVYFTVTNSVISNSKGVGVNAGSGTVFEVDSSSVSNNYTGFATTGGVIRISRNVIYDNVANYTISGGGKIATSGDNKVAVNGSTVPNATITQQ